MNSTTTHSSLATTVANSANESNFSLLHDDDDEELIPTIVGGSASPPKREVNDDSISTANATSEEHSYDTVLQQAAKWMSELEQIRDSTTWCHVENSFHRDVFAMMDVQTTFKYPSL